jgi:bifunctional UDP-N-acetylglucosamine pyrophosphorylase/glucosamine-1-phosphate N-acetyltransferase
VADGSRADDVIGIVLAAGEGKRLKSNRPKVLHPAAGRPLICHVLAALAPLPLARRVVVGSSRWKLIEEAIAAHRLSDGVQFAVQDAATGTAEAVRIGLEAAGDPSGTVMVVQGATPLIETDTLYRMLEVHRSAGAAATLLTASVHDPTGYGRIVRRDDGSVVKIVDRENAQGEYYLPDVVELLLAADRVVTAVETDAEEVRGVKNRSQLAYVSGLLRHRVCEQWMAEGVSIVDPRTTYIDTTVVIERDATIHPFTFLEGDTFISEGAEVGPQVRIVDSSVGPGAVVTFAVVRESTIGPEAVVGPFASLRPGNKLERKAKVGTFVEAKSSTIGEGSKANHLSYLGDAELGRGVNVGAGTITCNWDGREKHKTVIEDDAYISSDTMLVAPARIGKRAATGAGAVVRGEVPDDALAVGMPARIIEGKGDRMGRKEAPPEPED